MIENIKDTAHISSCGRCGNTSNRCICDRNWRGEIIKDSAMTAKEVIMREYANQRRINLNQPHPAQVKLDSIVEIRRLHEESIMSLLRLRTMNARDEAEKLIHMSFYDALERLEAQLKAELAET